MKVMHGVLLAAIPIGIAANVYLWRAPVPEVPKAPLPVITVDAIKKPAPAAVAALVAKPAPEMQQMAAKLRAQFGSTLQSPYRRARMMERLMRELSSKYPNDWVLKLNAVLKLAFPEQADALFQLGQQLQHYQTYMQANAARLQALSPEQRRAETWRIREEMFGPELANTLWRSERWNEAVANSVAAIAHDTRRDWTEKLMQYQAALSEAAGPDGQGALTHQRDTLTTTFLKADSIQKELREMPAPERWQALRQIRARMGMDETALERWSALDQEREQRWQRLSNYESQRQQLLSAPLSPDRDQELQRLRQDTFGGEAGIVANEEAQGIFRAQLPRIHGLN